MLSLQGMTAGSSNFTKLEVSAEACKYSYRAKIQMLLIFMETLDFDSLLQMIHDEIPLRQVHLLLQCWHPVSGIDAVQYSMI